MTIGIMGAMIEEVARLRQDLQHTHTITRGMRDYSRGTLYGRNVVLVCSKWGKVAAACTATSLIETFGVDLILFTGVAGAISLDLEIGDIVVADQLLQHDLDASPIFPRYEIPGLRVSKIPVKPELARLAAQSAEKYLRDDLAGDIPQGALAKFGIKKPKVRTGLIITGDQFIASTEKTNLMRAELPDAQCVEMEGAAAAQVGCEHDVPVVVVRTMSDKANHSSHIDFPAFLSQVASQFTRGIVKEFITSV